MSKKRIIILAGAVLLFGIALYFGVSEAIDANLND